MKGLSGKLTTKMREFLEVLPTHNYIPEDAAKAVGISPRTLDKWKGNRTLTRAVSELLETKDGVASESSMWALANKAIILGLTSPDIKVKVSTARWVLEKRFRWGESDVEGDKANQNQLDNAQDEIDRLIEAKLRIETLKKEHEFKLGDKRSASEEDSGTDA